MIWSQFWQYQENIFHKNKAVFLTICIKRHVGSFILQITKLLLNKKKYNSFTKSFTNIFSNHKTGRKFCFTYAIFDVRKFSSKVLN